MRRVYEWKNAAFWILVIGLTASMPYLCGYGTAEADLVWLYCIMLNIATAGISGACFGKIFGKQEIGLICSALYTISVFRICRLTVSGAVREGTALTFLPLVLYGLYRILTEETDEKRYRTSWIPFALGMSGIIPTHMPTLAVTIIAVFLFCVLHIRKMCSRSVLLELLKGTLASLAVNLWFLVLLFRDHPAWIADYVQAQAVPEDGLYFARLALHFWTVDTYGSDGTQSFDSTGVGLVLLVGLGVLLILWFSGKLRKIAGEAVPFAERAVIVSLFLLWAGSVRYPCFLGWGTVCLVLVYGSVLWYFDNSGKQSLYRLMAAVAVIGTATSGVYLLEQASCLGTFMINGKDAA
ncbi:MAG: hypothetical protein NC331_17575 [Lachnospiraceae bacterium]|nr:hypothetical protein [Lachnospiraceae bacterium]MCM1241154.1 hypothetical protein [Lachnospiraceae bacterium]